MPTGFLFGSRLLERDHGTKIAGSDLGRPQAARRASAMDGASQSRTLPGFLITTPLVHANGVVICLTLEVPTTLLTSCMSPAFLPRPSGFILPSVRVCLRGTENRLGFMEMEEVVGVRR